MKKEILQQFIDMNGKYLIGNYYKQSYGRNDDTRQAIFIAPDVDRKYWDKNIGTMPFDDVVKFAEEEIRTIIHLGNSYPPFQYGTRRQDFIGLKEVTCKPLELIFKCYQENVTEYYDVLKVMESLTKTDL